MSHLTYPEGAKAFIQFQGGTDWSQFDALPNADQAQWQLAAGVVGGDSCSALSTCPHGEGVYDLVGSGNTDWSDLVSGLQLMYKYAAHWADMSLEDSNVRRHMPIPG